MSHLDNATTESILKMINLFSKCSCDECKKQLEIRESYLEERRKKELEIQEKQENKSRTKFSM